MKLECLELINIKHRTGNPRMETVHFYKLIAKADASVLVIAILQSVNCGCFSPFAMHKPTNNC